jgi:hypothetical protein
MTGKQMVRSNQLRALIRQLERQPVSPQRDALLAEARRRVVAVETGVSWASSSFGVRAWLQCPHAG